VLVHRRLKGGDIVGMLLGSLSIGLPLQVGADLGPSAGNAPGEPGRSAAGGIQPEVRLPHRRPRRLTQPISARTYGIDRTPQRVLHHDALRQSVAAVGQGRDVGEQLFAERFDIEKILTDQALQRCLSRQQRLRFGGPG
jgi:hypothetical protein